MTWPTLPKGSTLARVAVFLGLVGVFVVAWFISREKINWPADFGKAKGNAPQVVVEVAPDFGYRIGDLVPVTVYLKQHAGTEIDFGAMALEGDFESRKDFAITQIDDGQGGKLLCVRMVLQSFQSKDKLTASISLPWQEVDKKDVFDLRVPLVTVYTSKTYDGRGKAQDGPLTIVYGPKIARGILCIIVGVAGVVASWFWMRRIRAGLPDADEPMQAASPRTLAHLRFQKVWSRIEAGDLTQENFQEIAVIVREFLNVEAILVDDIKIALGNGHPHVDQIVCVLTLCDRVIYKNDVLADKELAQLKSSFDEFILLKPFPVWPAASE